MTSCTATLSARHISAKTDTNVTVGRGRLAPPHCHARPSPTGTEHPEDLASGQTRAGTRRLP